MVLAAMIIPFVPMLVPLTAAACRTVLTQAGRGDVIELEIETGGWLRYEREVAEGLSTWVDRFGDDAGFVERARALDIGPIERGDVDWVVWIASSPPVPPVLEGAP